MKVSATSVLGYSAALDVKGLDAVGNVLLQGNLEWDIRKEVWVNSFKNADTNITRIIVEGTEGWFESSVAQ